MTWNCSRRFYFFILKLSVDRAGRRDRGKIDSELFYGIKKGGTAEYFVPDVFYERQGLFLFLQTEREYI